MKKMLSCFINVMLIDLMKSFRYFTSILAYMCLVVWVIYFNCWNIFFPSHMSVWSRGSTLKVSFSLSSLPFWLSSIFDELDLCWVRSLMSSTCGLKTLSSVKPGNFCGMCLKWKSLDRFFSPNCVERSVLRFAFELI